ISSTITVRLSDYNSQTLLASTTFTGTDGAVLDGGYPFRFKDISPVTLTPGTDYMIWADGFYATDQNYNTAGLGSTTANLSNGAITFGSSYYS
ncbi:hypothetical protein ABTM48_19625, partial [Acinetobacter baumannii]